MGTAKRRRPTSSDLAGELIARFKATFTGPPRWAWQFAPPVPLVGRQYRPGRGLLIYASAENLSWMNLAARIARSVRFTGEPAWNRYRVQADDSGGEAAEFFPDVGIQPVTNGGLLAAGLFIAGRLGLATRTRPRAFLETIAVSNWCKFSIRAATNVDYIADVKKLTASLPFVIGELAVLRPAAVLVPAQVWRHPIIQAAMRGASPWTRFLPVPQFNPRVVNIHLAKYARRAASLRSTLAGMPLAAWMAHLQGLNVENAWRYLAMLMRVATGA
ncbi:MAG: hypothetical protein NTV86_03665 [Planctomycetota bacterium]|nr:hypothetical protein [Planctomycetota bacterium]